MRIWREVLLVLVAPIMAEVSLGADKPERRVFVPDEIQAVGGAGASLSHAGVATLSDLSAVRLNPAMLYRNQGYDLSAGYFWPAQGRPFYKAGVVDGTTSKIVAGFEYTGLQARPEEFQGTEDELDSPISKRASLAFAVPTETFAYGLAVHYSESVPFLGSSVKKEAKGFTLGAGVVAYLTQQLRFGVSLQNFNNKGLELVSPKTLRAGFSWEHSSGNVTLNLDYRDREALEVNDYARFPEQLALIQRIGDETSSLRDKMVFTGLQVKTFDLLKVFASGGVSLADKSRSELAGGIGLYQKSFVLAYSVHQNLPTRSQMQNALHLSLTVKM